jgi:hypothetical protein
LSPYFQKWSLDSYEKTIFTELSFFVQCLKGLVSLSLSSFISTLFLVLRSFCNYFSLKLGENFMLMSLISKRHIVSKSVFILSISSSKTFPRSLYVAIKGDFWLITAKGCIPFRRASSTLLLSFYYIDSCFSSLNLL